MGAPFAFELRRVRLDAVSSLRSSRETIADREVIIVGVTDAGGHVGWGECSALPLPGYTPEYLSGAWALMRDVLIPGILSDPAGALDFLADVPGHPMARAAIVGALVDVELRGRGQSLADALSEGTGPRTRVLSNAVIGIHDDPGDLESSVADALGAGHKSVKLKVDPPHVLDAVGNVRHQWPDLDLALDANGSFGDADSATEVVRRVEQIAGRLSYIEQPLAADDLVGSAVLARRIGTPIALDESVTSLGEATTALSLGALGALNLKPARVGGPLTAMAVARIVAAEGFPVFCGGMVESGIGRGAALAVAAQQVCTLPADLGPSSRYHVLDLTAPFELVDGALQVPDGPGIGVVPDEQRLEGFTLETYRL